MIYTIEIKEPFFSQIIGGFKQVEGRRGDHKLKDAKTGDILEIHRHRNYDDDKIIYCVITEIQFFINLDNFIENVGTNAIPFESYKKIKEIYLDIYPNITQMIALHIKYLPEK